MIVDTSRWRIERLKATDSADYIHMALLDRAETAEAEVERLREVAEWFERQRQAAIHRAGSIPKVSEDEEVLRLCKRHGFGAVMDSAARQWAKVDGLGAFFIGGSIGDTSAQAALRKGEGE